MVYFELNVWVLQTVAVWVCVWLEHFQLRQNKVNYATERNKFAFSKMDLGRIRLQSSPCPLLLAGLVWGRARVACLGFHDEWEQLWLRMKLVPGGSIRWRSGDTRPSASRRVIIQTVHCCAVCQSFMKCAAVFCCLNFLQKWELVSSCKNSEIRSRTNTFWQTILSVSKWQMKWGISRPEPYL